MKSLVGTTWWLKSPVNLSFYGNNNVSIKVLYNNTTYNSFVFSYAYSSGQYRRGILFDSTTVVPITTASSAVPTIRGPFTFTGGSDVNNLSLINWLLSNAIQIPPIDLTNTTWKLKPQVNITENQTFNINVSYNNSNYTNMSLVYTNQSDTYWKSLTLGSGAVSVITLTSADNPISTNEDVFTIIDGSDVHNGSLINWLINNAYNSTAVGTEGLSAIKDFIKPYVITENDIGNSSYIMDLHDNLTILYFGHEAFHYTWDIPKLMLLEAKKWNFWEVTEYSGAEKIILHKVSDNCYEGTAGGYNSTYKRYKYYITLGEYSCDVWRYGVTTVYDSDNNAEELFDIQTLFDFTTEELLLLFGQLTAGNSFVFTKTNTDISNIDLGTNANLWYLKLPLDFQNTNQGYVEFHHCNSIAPVSNLSAEGAQIEMVWMANSYFLNKHQIWIAKLHAEVVSSQTEGFVSLTLINTSDLAIQAISASDYADLPQPDSNTLYFVPEE